MKKFNRSVLTLAFGAIITLAGCGGGGGVAAFCDKMQDLDDNDPTEGMEEGSPEFFDASIDAMEEVRDAAPDEIKGDVESMLAGFEELSEVDPANLEEADFAELQERLTELGESADRVETFIDTNCEE